jgi:rubrerythrin
MRLTSLDEILRYAIRKEADEAAFYQMAADRSNPGVRKAFLELSEAEKGHRRKLEGFDLKKIDQMELKKSQDLGIGEALDDVPFSSDMAYADLLRMAIKNEEKAHLLYASTAQIAPEPALKKLLLILAQEELSHKEKLEKIYDDEILKEF